MQTLSQTELALIFTYIHMIKQHISSPATAPKFDSRVVNNYSTVGNSDRLPKMNAPFDQKIQGSLFYQIVKMQNVKFKGKQKL